MKKSHAPTKVVLDEEGKKLVLSKLISISGYPHAIMKDGTSCNAYDSFMTDKGLAQSLDMKGDVLDLAKYLFSVKESPSYLNDSLDEIMDSLFFLTQKTGFRQRVASLSTKDGILKEKYRVVKEELPDRTVRFVSEISGRYGLGDYMKAYRAQGSSQPPAPPGQSYSTHPKSADRLEIKRFEGELMRLWFEKDFATGAEIKDAFAASYEKALLSGLEKDKKEYLKNLKENDIDLLDRDDVVRKGDLTYKKITILVEKLRPYSG